MRSARGFTLVELLVVIAIIGSVAAMFLINFGRQTGKARDVERKSDLRQYQAALESYANRSNGLYPIRNTITTADTLCSTLNVTVCPTDPISTRGGYRYRSNAEGTRFVLWAFLEFKPTNEVFIVCSDGQVGEMTRDAFTAAGGVPASADCPI